MGTAQLSFVELVRGGATGSQVTGSYVTCSREVCSADTRLFPRFFLTRVVVQVSKLPEVTNGHVNPSGFPWVCGCATASCAIFTLVGSFDRK
jgi:hypothetical protein